MLLPHSDASCRIQASLKWQAFCRLWPDERPGIALADQAVDGDVSREPTDAHAPVPEGVEERLRQLEQPAIEERYDGCHGDGEHAEVWVQSKGSDREEDVHEAVREVHVRELRRVGVRRLR